jgi:hypothetical protein
VLPEFGEKDFPVLEHFDANNEPVKVREALLATYQTGRSF